MHRNPLFIILKTNRNFADPETASTTEVMLQDVLIRHSIQQLERLDLMSATFPKNENETTKISIATDLYYYCHLSSLIMNMDINENP